MSITLQVIECVAGSSEPLARAEIERITGISPATLARQLHSLCEGGYLRRAGRGYYAISHRTLSLGQLVFNNSGYAAFLPLMRQLAQETGLNVELYLITEAGPIFLLADGDASGMRVDMQPGQMVSSSFHPVVGIYFAQNPDKVEVWAEDRELALAGGVLKGYVKTAAAGGVIYERGNMRPELARACVGFGGMGYVLGVSGLLSEFTQSEGEIEQLMHEQAAIFCTAFAT